MTFNLGKGTRGRGALRSSFVFVALLASPLLVLAGSEPTPVAPGDLLGSTGNAGNDLIGIDPGTGAGSLRFGLGAFGPVTEIEFRDDNVLFGSTGGGSASIITIDPDTGVETLVGAHAPSAVNGLEFVGSTLYGAFFQPGDLTGPEGGSPTQLVTVDTTDGTLTLIGPLDGYSPVRGLAYDPATATMFGVGTPLPPPPAVPEGASDELFTIDLATGDTTTVGPVGSFLLVGGIEFDAAGVLYGGVAQGSPGAGGTEGGIQGGDLVTIDLATGAASLVGATGFPALSGLAFVPVGIGPGEPTVAIPTASETGLIVLAALLFAAAVFVLRRT